LLAATACGKLSKVFLAAAKEKMRGSILTETTKKKTTFLRGERHEWEEIELERTNVFAFHYKRRGGGEYSDNQEISTDTNILSVRGEIKEKRRGSPDTSQIIQAPTGAGGI